MTHTQLSHNLVGISERNGYYYKVTNHKGNCSGVCTECQSFGADIAAFGMKNFKHMTVTLTQCK